MKISKRTHYSVQQAADKAGLTRQAIHHAIKMGNLAMDKKGNVFFIRKKSLEKYMKEVKTGRPPAADSL